MAAGLRRMWVVGAAGSWLVWVMPDRGQLPRSILVCDPLPAGVASWPSKYRSYQLRGVEYVEFDQRDAPAL